MAIRFMNVLTGLPLEYQRAVESEERRQSQLYRAYKAYAGATEPAFRGDDNRDSVRLSWPRLIVDKGVNWLFGKDLPIELGSGATADEEWLNAAWPMDRRMVQLQKLAVNGGISGHVFAKLVSVPGSEFPKLVILDPMTVTATFNPDDIEETVAYRIQYSALAPDTGKPILFVQRHQRNERGTWTITDTTEDAGSGRVLTSREYEWPFTFSQIVECQNLPAANEYWGEADLTFEVLELCETIEEIASHTNKMVRIYANPILWVSGLSGDSAGELDLTPGGVVLLPDAEMRLNQVEPKADVAGSLNTYTRFIDDLHSFTHIPKIATDATQGQQIGRASGSAMRYHYTPIIERTEIKRRTYGAFVSEIVRRMFAVAGRPLTAAPRLLWAEMVPDPMADIQRAQALVTLGASKDTVWRTAGIADPAAEEEKVAESGTLTESTPSPAVSASPDSDGE